MLLKRLNTDQKIAPIVAQFVPIKLDVDTEEYRIWRRDHASEGDSIPKLFVVRGDGETLYGKSGSLKGDALPNMLIRALERSGQILSAKNVQALTAASDRFEALKDAGDIAGAIKALSKVKKMGPPGKIPSYAASASRLNESVNQMVDEVKIQLKDLAKPLEEASTLDQLQAILKYLEIRREYGALRIIKPDLSAYQKLLTSSKELGPLYREAKILDTSRIAKTKSSQARATAKLRALVSSTEIEEVKSAAEKLLAEMEQAN